MKHSLTFFSSLLLLIASLINTKNEANAFTLIYDSLNSGSGQYVYDLQLAPGETIYNSTNSSLGSADVLNFTNLAGITSVTTSGIYSVVGFDSTSVNLVVSTTTTNSTLSPTTLDNIVTFFSNFPAGTVNFDATFDDSLGSVASTITGPVATATEIPEPSMLFGLATFLGFATLFKRNKNQTR